MSSERFVRGPVRAPVRAPVRDPMRGPVKAPVRGPMRGPMKKRGFVPEPSQATGLKKRRPTNKVL